MIPTSGDPLRHPPFLLCFAGLGQFESGVTAALLGAVPAAARGGLGTVLAPLPWMKPFPALRDLERLERSGPC